MTSHNNVVIDIEAMLERAEAPVTEECCIYRVPFNIRRHNEDAYTPKVVSIGPFHHNCHSHLQNMERHKLIFCKTFLARTKTNWDSWIRYIEKEEPNIRRCYSETLKFSKDELVKMIFVDSGFIFELFWIDYYGEWSRLVNHDTFFFKPWLAGALVLDLLLLENQLPFYVLDGLFNLTFGTVSDNSIPSLTEFTFNYFDYYNRSELNFHNISMGHFTDLIRTFQLQHPTVRRQARTIKELSTIYLPSATELSEAGVKFKINSESDCLLDLRFSGRILQIPKFRVEDWTEVVFRNMVAMEQCHYPHESYITDYVLVLDFLVNTSKDVDILIRDRVLVNWLGDSDSVANLFNGLLKNISQSSFNSHYFKLCQDLNAFHRDPCNKLKSTLRRDYFKSPWQTAVSIAGILLLILSLVQTVCSVLQVILPSPIIIIIFNGFLISGVVHVTD